MYLFCMLIFPVIVTIFFTSLMSNGQPTDMPVGVVDLDNTSTTRSIIRKLDAFQTTKIVKRYTNVSEARNAIQRNEIYAFLYIPEGTTSELLSMRQPKISFTTAPPHLQPERCFTATSRPYLRLALPGQRRLCCRQKDLQKARL